MSSIGCLILHMIKLWTFQHKDCQGILEDTGQLTAEWTRIGVNEHPSFEWMVAKMHERGMDCEGRPPIWAFLIDHGLDYPSVGSASALLSDFQIEEGPVVIEFHAPTEFVLLSDYGPWCEYCFGYPELETNLEAMFQIDEHAPVDEGTSIQACLPLIKKSWVQRIQILDIDSRDEDWNRPV